MHDFEDRVDVLPQGNETILLVEDDEFVRGVAVKILKRLGYDVLVASSGNEALLINETKKGAIDLLLTDVVMPNMNGKELVEQMKMLTPGLEVLYMSGYTDPGVDLREHIEEGASYLAKPLTIDKLARKIRDVLDKHNPLGEKPC